MKVNLENVINNETFKAKIESASDLTEVVNILAEYGIETTVEELTEAMPKGEMSEADLDTVAGGIVRLNPFYWISKWIVGAALDSRGIC